MGTFLDASDLTPFAEIDPAKAELMIEDAESLAVLAAPCLGSPDDLTDRQRSAVRALLRGAIIRWNEAGSGLRQSVTTGPFGETLDTTQQRRGMYWPSEITSLQGICGNDQGGVYSLDMSGPDRDEGYWSAPNVWTPL
jgi:hypothetical protein